jgi:hypothetical protein
VTPHFSCASRVKINTLLCFTSKDYKLQARLKPAASTVCAVSPHLRESEEAGGGQARDEDASEDDGEGVQRHKLAPPGQMNSILRMVAWSYLHKQVYVPQWTNDFTSTIYTTAQMSAVPCFFK